MSAPAVPIIDEHIAYCTHCTWWDSSSLVVHLTMGSDGVADVCPMCSGRVLDKASLRHFLLGMDEYEKTHPGYRDFVMWQRGKSFASPHLAACAYFNETGKEVTL